MFPGPSKDPTKGTRETGPGLGSKALRKTLSPLASGSSGRRESLPPLPAAAASPPSSSACRGTALQNAPPHAPPSVVGLPPLRAQAGPVMAFSEAKWKDVFQLRASTSGANFAVRAADVVQQEESTTPSRTGQDKSTKATNKKKNIPTSKDGKVNKPNEVPLSGTDVVRILLTNRGLEYYCLKEVDGDSYRPYDLRVVDFSEAGSEYYIFSRNAVVHASESGQDGPVRLEEWYRESLLWTALQDVPFFRNYRLQKVFTRWHGYVRKMAFQRRRDALQDVLLTAVPQFMNALFVFARITEELKETHWLPQDDSTTYTLHDFNTVLMSKNQACLQMFEKLQQYRTGILNTIRESTYKEYHKLRLQLEYCGNSNERSSPIYLQQAHRKELRKKLNLAENMLQKLGNFAALIHHMTTQSLVTFIRQDAVSYLGSIFKRDKCPRGCLFQTELSFTSDGHVTVDPPIRRFQEAMSEVLQTVGKSVIQMCDSCGYFLEINKKTNPGLAQDLPSHLSCIHQSADIGQNMTSRDGPASQPSSCCWLELGEWLVVPNQLMVQGCYYPLSKVQLEWQIGINDVAKEVEKEHGKIMQEARSEIQQLCETYMWMAEVHLFTNEWNSGFSESLKGRPAALYEEHITKVRQWIERVHAVPSSVSHSKQLFLINCTPMKENLGRRLRSIEEDLLEQLTEQMRLLSESLVSDLTIGTAELRTEPQDLQEFSNYYFSVTQSVKALADVRKRLEYIHSLKETACKNYREMSNEEVTVEEKVLELWDCYVKVLKEAENTARQRLPSVADALDKMFSSSACDLKKLVSDATSGPFLDPTRNADEMVSRLNAMHTHVCTLSEKLEKISGNIENLQGRPVDLNCVTTAVCEFESRQQLWKLRTVYTKQMQEWKQSLFSEFVVSQAQEKIAEWKVQALSLTRTVPAHDAVLQEALRNLESFSHQLALIAKLQSPTVQEKHWRAVYRGMGFLYVPEMKVTVAELISQELEVHQKLINQICRDAKAEWDMGQTFLKLQREWEARLFQLEKFTFPVWHHRFPHKGLSQAGTPVSQSAAPDCYDVRFIIKGLDLHLAEVENDLMILSNMSISPRSAEFRPQVDHWLQLLQELEKLLDFFERYQQKWAFLNKMLNDASLNGQKIELLEQFQPVDEEFEELVRSISSDPHILNIVCSKKTNDRFCGSSLCQIFIKGLSTMEAIFCQMGNLLEGLCAQFPRLWLLSDREIIQLLSLHPTPSALLPFLRRFFKGVHGVEANMSSAARELKSCPASSESHRQMEVLGFFGSLQEHVTFISPLEPNFSPILWCRAFEKGMHLSMVQLIKQCASALQQLEPVKAGSSPLLNADQKNALPVLDLLPAYPLQCLLVAEEVVWCDAIQKAFQESSPVKLSDIKTHNSTQLTNLCNSIRVRIAETRSGSLVSDYKTVCLRALVLLKMNCARQLSRLMEAQCKPESSFEWLSLMKYKMNLEAQRQNDDRDQPTCYVDVLGYRLQYGYEYFGPEDWLMVHTPSTDRARLGILLALTSYRCGFVSGPRMSGKKSTVVQLGKALGRQMIILQCWPNMRPGVVQQMLFGALQTGAWLILDSVDLLTKGVLSSLGQYLVDIHQSLYEIMRLEAQRVHKEPKDKTANAVAWCQNMVEPECQLEFSGKSISVNLDYGCVLISSEGYSSEVPDSLRVATRPVSIIDPDYRLLAEVLLASIGFSDALTLSQRLVSLISMAKDSFFLPDFISGGQSCYLVILQKIISTSGMYFQQSLRDGEVLDGIVSLHNVTAKVTEKEDDDDKAAKDCGFMHGSQCASVIRGLMEETAIVKAVLSVLLPFIYKDKKASQFYIIFKDTFPAACQFPFFQEHIEEEEKNQLKDALTQELERKGLQANSQIIGRALTLHQTMKVSPAIMLVGSPGSGKTTCCSALSGALNDLAAAAVEHVEDVAQAEPQIPASPRSTIDTVVLFPNVMSSDELYGHFCEARSWKDGAIAKVLRNFEQHQHTTFGNTRKGNQMCNVKWLVMDGEPLGHPGWLDYMATLCKPREPCLCLPSGETLMLSPSHLKLLVEITDLSDASPSALCRYNLIHFTGADLWQSVWETEIDALSVEHNLDQETLKMWTCLAGELFSSTLSLLRQKTLTSALHAEGESGSCKNPNYGLQEIMSFVRILRAVLKHFEKDVITTPTETDGRDTALHKTHKQDTKVQPQLERHCRNRNVFLAAYVWGFGGHLHPRHWPQFDLLARQMLFNSRYRIEVPDEDTVFEYFLNINSKNYHCIIDTQLAYSTIPEYGKYSYLLNLMLEAHQPVLLAGETGSGKTTLCENLLSFKEPHISLPAGALMTRRDLRSVLNKTTMGSMTKQSRLHLFVDDLHEAPCDVFGKISTAVEMLRQSISKGGIATFEDSRFKFLSSEHINYMATGCFFGSGYHRGNMTSPRLSRLFSIFVLPSLSPEVILSMHAPQLNNWLKGVPFMQDDPDMAFRIITATESLYHTVCSQFQPTAQRPHFMFSHHDLQKVFQGMCLWQPNGPNSQENDIPITLLSENLLPGAPESRVRIVHLWMHECSRTFSDRLCSADEKKIFVSLIAKAAKRHYGVRLFDEPQSASFDSPPTVTNTEPADAADARKTICQGLDTVSDGNVSLSGKPFVPKDGEESKLKKEVKTVMNNGRLSLQVERVCDDAVSRQPQEPKSDGQSGPKKGCRLNKSPSRSQSNDSEATRQDTHPLPPQILEHVEDVLASSTYGPEISEALDSVDQQQTVRCGASYQEQSLDVLVRHLSNLMKRKEEAKEEEVDMSYDTSRYVVHKQRALQLVHILRALLLPGGHGMLIGSERGTGRKTTVRLAAHLMGYHLTEVHPGNESMLHQIIKEAVSKTRVEKLHVIILVHERTSQSVREQLVVLMAHGSCPGLCTDEELGSLVSSATPVKTSKQCLMESWIFEKYSKQRSRRVHVFLMMPLTTTDSTEAPTNTTQEWNEQMTKALRFCCCVDVYQSWSRESLAEVAAYFLKAIPGKKDREGSEASLPVVMATVHQSACRYASVLLRTQPFKPQTYVEFMATFYDFCNLLHKQGTNQVKRLSTVVARLDDMKNKTVQYKDKREKLRDVITESQQNEKTLIRAVYDEKSLLEEAEHRCVEEENKVHHLEQQLDVQKQVTALFLSGLKLCEYLSSSDLEEVRHYRDPPSGVVRIMDAICLLFNRPPGWENAKRLLLRDNFYQELEHFDSYNLTDEQLQRLGEIVNSPQFVPESVRDVSKACESLCRWVQGVYERSVQLQVMRKQHLKALLKEPLCGLELARKHKEEVHRHLEERERRLQLVQTQLQDQLVELQRVEILERDAVAAAHQMEKPTEVWRTAAQEAELDVKSLTGDALILAAVTLYLGPFGPDVRTELLGKWRQLCQTGSIHMNPEDPRSSLFSDSDVKPLYIRLNCPIPASKTLQSPLGRVLGLDEWQVKDILSAKLILKLLLQGCKRTWIQQWPLLADTHHLDESSLRRLITGENITPEEEAERGEVVRADDPELLEKLRQAAEKGFKVLLTDVERAVPSPRFLARLVRGRGCRLPGSKPAIEPIHPDFRLFLSTRLPVRLLDGEVHPSILAEARVLDLSLSSVEIQEAMLTQLLQSERSELLSQHARLQNEKQSLQEKLLAREADLLDYILKSDTPLLLDSGFLPYVAACQEATEKLEAELQQLSAELEDHEVLLAAPRELVKVAPAFYQALQEVSRLSPLYFFPLHGFIAAMHEAFIEKGAPLMPWTTGIELRSVAAEVAHRMVTQLLSQYRPRLFTAHFAVLKLLVSVALMQHNQLCSEAERTAFLRGLQDIASPRSVPPTTSRVFTSQHALSSWIAPHTHSELLRLNEIPALRGLIASFNTSPSQWQEYLHSSCSTVAGTVPCESYSHLSLLQRALLWKTVRPHCLERLIDTLSTCCLCPCVQAAAPEPPHPGNPDALAGFLVRHEGPVVLILPSQDQWTSIPPLHLIKQLAQYVPERMKVEVKVISLGHSCDRNIIMSALDRAVHDAKWLVFNNCHLLDQWDDEVVAYLNQFLSFKDEKFTACFRLWFITREDATRSIPAAVRMCALRLVCDSPWDLREELSCSLRQVASVVQPQSASADNMELILRCAVFHSALLQRQTSKYENQRGTYYWSQEDLRALVEAHLCIGSLCHDKTKALQLLAASLVHGGHVQDSAEMEVIESVASVCFRTASASLCDSGPQLLSDISSNPSRLDSSGLLQLLQQRVQDLKDISDPLVLGFSEAAEAEIISMKSCNLNRLLQASQTPLGTPRSSGVEPNRCATAPPHSHPTHRLHALKRYLHLKSGSNAGVNSPGPLRDFLQAEWDDLSETVSSLLLQHVRRSTPAFAPLLELANLSRMERRAELLNSYLWRNTVVDPPGAYRLSAFKNAKGFLVALRREFAKLNGRHAADVDLHFQAQSDRTFPASFSLHAVYLCGLELRGAAWDKKLEALQDARHVQPWSPTSVSVRIRVKSRDTRRHASPHQSSDLQETGYVPNADAPPSARSQFEVYQCPVCVDGGQESGTCALSDVDVVATVPLQTKLDPVLCSLRRVKLVSAL